MNNIPKNKTSAYPASSPMSAHTEESGALKIKSSLTTFSEMTKGLKVVILRRLAEMLSNGRIKPETKRRKLPNEIEAKVPVSSDLKA